MAELHIQVGTDDRYSRLRQAPVPLEVFETETCERIETKSLFGKTARVSVEPGDFRITAHLPSGRAVHANARVLMGDHHHRVNLPVEEVTFDAEFGHVHPTKDQLFSVDRWDGDAIRLSNRTGNRIELRFWNSCGRDRFKPANAPSPTRDRKYSWRMIDGMFSSLSATVDHTSVPLWMALIIDGGKIDQLIALPPASQVDIAIGRGSHPDDLRPRVVVIGNLVEAEALLAYLHHGSAFAARLLGPGFVEKQVESQKNTAGKTSEQVRWRNSASAVAAGYFSLAWSEHPENFAHWLEDFALSTPWLPDSNIIYASYLMMDQKVDVVKVRSLLLGAYERGIPLYTDGLRRLAENLAYLNELFEKKDSSVKWAAQETNKWTLFADPTVVTTTIRAQKENSFESVLDLNCLVGSPKIDSI